MKFSMNRRDALKAGAIAAMMAAIGGGVYFYGSKSHEGGGVSATQPFQPLPSSKASYVILPKDGGFEVFNTISDSKEFESTDASSAIQYAINKLSVTGGEVVLKRGVYTLTKTITLSSHVSLIGENGSDLVVVTNSDGVVIPENSQFVRLSGFKIHGAGPITQGALIRVKNHVYQIAISDIEAHDYYDGIVIEGAYPPGDNWGIFMERVHVYNSLHDGLAIVGYGNTYFINEVIIAESSNNCITLRDTADGVMAFENVHCFDSVNYSLHAYNTDGRLVQHKRFIAVNFEGLSTHPKSVRIENCMNIEFLDVEVAGMANNGIELVNCSDSRIIGGRIINNSLGSPGEYAGVYLENSSEIIVEGNSIYDTNMPGSKTQGYGIIEAGSSNFNVITGNVLRGNSIAPYKLTGSNDVINANIT